jgi:hypothetical protein
MMALVCPVKIEDVGACRGLGVGGPAVQLCAYERGCHTQKESVRHRASRKRNATDCSVTVEANSADKWHTIIQ